MEYSSRLCGKDVGKISLKNKCEILRLADPDGIVREYTQMVSLKLKDKVRCIIREKYDEDFGEYYYVESKDTLCIETDEDILCQLYLYYIKSNENVL